MFLKAKTDKLVENLSKLDKVVNSISQTRNNLPLH